MQVKFKRYNTSELESLSIDDGSILFDTEEQKIYLDDGAERKLFGSGKSSEVVLFEDTNGTTENVTLNENVSNFSYIEIYYNSYDTYRSSRKIDDPDDSKTMLTNVYYAASDFVITATLIQIENNKINVSNSIKNSSFNGISQEEENLFRITKVVGYK